MSKRNAAHNFTYAAIGFLVCTALAVIGNWVGWL